MFLNVIIVVPAVRGWPHMHKSYLKRVYYQPWRINLDYSKISSFTTLLLYQGDSILRHAIDVLNTLHSMYIVRDKGVYHQIPSIGSIDAVKEHLFQFKSVIHYTQLYTCFLHLYILLPILEIWLVNSFVPHYIHYYGVCLIHLWHVLIWNPPDTGVKL